MHLCISTLHMHMHSLLPSLLVPLIRPSVIHFEDFFHINTFAPVSPPPISQFNAYKYNLIVAVHLSALHLPELHTLEFQNLPTFYYSVWYFNFCKISWRLHLVCDLDITLCFLMSGIISCKMEDVCGIFREWKITIDFSLPKPGVCWCNLEDEWKITTVLI